MGATAHGAEYGLEGSRSASGIEDFIVAIRALDRNPRPCARVSYGDMLSYGDILRDERHGMN